MISEVTPKDRVAFCAFTCLQAILHPPCPEILWTDFDSLKVWFDAIQLTVDAMHLPPVTRELVHILATFTTNCICTYTIVLDARLPQETLGVPVEINKLELVSSIRFLHGFCNSRSRNSLDESC